MKENCSPRILENDARPSVNESTYEIDKTLSSYISHMNSIIDSIGEDIVEIKARTEKVFGSYPIDGECQLASVDGDCFQELGVIINKLSKIKAHTNPIRLSVISSTN